MSYKLTVNNTGTANTTSVRVVDTLPAGVGFVSADTTSLFVCSSAGTPVTVTCDGGAVNQGANATIVINALAPAAPFTGNIANTAVVDPDNTVPESNELNNTSATVGTTVTSAPAPQGITISKEDSPDPVVPGAILQYTIVVKNIATSRADDVVVVDGTQSLEAASIIGQPGRSSTARSGTTGGCVVTAPQVKCSIRYAQPRRHPDHHDPRPGRRARPARRSSTRPRPRPTSRTSGVAATATALTTVKPAVDLTITKADAPDPVCARSWPQGGRSPAHRHPTVSTAAGGAVPTLLAAPGLSWRPHLHLRRRQQRHPERDQCGGPRSAACSASSSTATAPTAASLAPSTPPTS